MLNLGNRRWWALGALTLAVLAVGLDGTVLSVALPTLATALPASESDLQLFSSGHLLVRAAMRRLVGAFALVGECRAEVRRRLDVVGVVASTAGLVGVTYGLIEAGRNGWTDASALVPMIAGLVVLVGFFLWERRLSLRPGGQPLVDLALFRSAGFTWGVILAAPARLAMIGVLFTMPRVFQGVLGTDALGSGLRLLPLVAGLVVRAAPPGRFARVAWGE